MLPEGDLAARLTLVGLVVLLHNLLEFPRNGVRAVVGKPLTSLLVFLVLGGSLVVLVLALRRRVPRWRWLHARGLQGVVLLALLVSSLVGLHQLGAMAVSAFQPPSYPNDGTTLDHYAAQQLLEGHNPYVTGNVVAAVCLYGQDPEHTTPLGQGRFAADYPNYYPSPAELRAAFGQRCALRQMSPPPVEFESHVSYPALAFLPLVPLVWAGLPSVVPFFVLCFVALVALLLLAAPPRLLPWVALLALADLPLLNATVGGVLDVFYILLLFVAWRWWRRPVLSALFLGLAIAAKQLAWFFLPFYAILIWRERGWREALARLSGAGLVFALINGPFLVADPRAWIAGVLAPQVDRMFPLGNGLVGLSVSGLLPLAPSWVYSALLGLGIVACIAWYWRYGRSMPEVGFVLAVVPLFFGWRSLTTYFYFVALPAFALLLAHAAEANRVRVSTRILPTWVGVQRPRRVRKRRR